MLEALNKYIEVVGCGLEVLRYQGPYADMRMAVQRVAAAVGLPLLSKLR
ncbi:hypothetical protein [Meiothermus granaticius]|nr:hypothetical protein [Meiothermus granaticius]GEM88501.1 hypothetical protein MGR01S_31260 [Meiothermus granaticius NBRC 107808]